MQRIYDPPGYGPIYPALGASVQKFRRMAKNGITAMDSEERRAYGQAVHTAILALQRQELQRELPSYRCHCASGTNYSAGRDIHEAIRQQQRSALLNYASTVRRKRTPGEWEAMYHEAMAEKRKADARMMKLAA